MEVYEWNTNPPTKYFAYVNEKTKKLTTWTGDILGTVRLGAPYKTYGFGVSTRCPIWVKGTNGKTYYGTYYQSSGDYARITINKKQAGDTAHGL
jgi:hypothetical protein